MAGVTHNTYEIDATGLRPGRLATQIAMILMGKYKPTFTWHIDDGAKVRIINVDKVIFSGKKLDQKDYKRHSMYPGGLKETPAKKVMTEDPKEVVRHAVAKMIPKNKFRANRLKRLSFK